MKSIVIVGGGMVGLACAVALAQENFAVTLLEARSDFSPALPTPDSPFDTRVVAITRASAHFLAHCGVWDTIVQTRASAYGLMKVWDSVMDGRITFDAAEFFEPDLGHIIEQSVITGALWQVLQSYSVIVKKGVTITTLQTVAAGVSLVLSDGEALEASLVIGADGAQSLLRTLCQIDTRGWDYDQSAIVATVKGTLSHEQTAFQRFMPEGPLALLPLSCPYHASIVWTCPPAKAQHLMDSEVALFEATLSQESEGVMGKMTLVSDRHSFALKTHHAKNYAKSGCVLVGDAAHTLHPLAGQGVNLGFLDVAVLVTECIRARDQGGIDPQPFLSRYERQRRYHNQGMIWAMTFFKRSFGSTSPVIQQLRNRGLQWVDNSALLKRCFANIALGKWGPIPAIAKSLI